MCIALVEERTDRRIDRKITDENGMFKLMEEVQVKDTAGNKKMLRLNCETFQKKWTPIKYISHEPAAHS